MNTENNAQNMNLATGGDLEIIDAAEGNNAELIEIRTAMEAMIPSDLRFLRVTLSGASEPRLVSVTTSKVLTAAEREAVRNVVPGLYQFDFNPEN